MSKPFPLDAGSWPPRLHCDAALLKLQSQVSSAIHAPDAQWYIQIVPVDANGVETDEPKVKQMVQVLVERDLVFEIRCDGAAGTPGMLYLCGLRIPPHEDSLQGVFKPHVSSNARVHNNGNSSSNNNNNNALTTSGTTVGYGGNVGWMAGATGVRDALGGLGLSSGVTNGLASPLQPLHVGGAEAGGRRIWQGFVQVRGHVNDMMIPCAAVQYVTDERGHELIDASGWPFLLQCDAESLRSGAQLVEEMNCAQWYVRFAAVDGNGCEREEPRLVGLVKVLVERHLVFEIRCAGLGGTAGWLYLWGLHVAPHGLSFLGVFRPDGVDGMGGQVAGKGMQSKVEGASVR